MDYIVIEQNDSRCPRVYGSATFGECLGKFTELVNSAGGTLKGGETYWTDGDGYEVSISCIESL